MLSEKYSDVIEILELDLCKIPENIKSNASLSLMTNLGRLWTLEDDKRLIGLLN